jgi:hypothetical protein
MDFLCLSYKYYTFPLICQPVLFGIASSYLRKHDDTTGAEAVALAAEGGLEKVVPSFVLHRFIYFGAFAPGPLLHWA